MSQTAESLLNELRGNDDVHVPTEMICVHDLLKDAEKQEIKIKAYLAKLSKASSREEQKKIERLLKMMLESQKELHGRVSYEY